MTAITLIGILCLGCFALGEGDDICVSASFEKKNYVHGDRVVLNYDISGGSGEYAEILYSWDIVYNGTAVSGEMLPLAEETGTVASVQKKGDKIKVTFYVTDSTGRKATFTTSAAALGRTFFEWVHFILEKYGQLFLQGTGFTLLIALVGTVVGFMIGLFVAIQRTIPLPEKYEKGSVLRRALIRVRSFILGVYIEVFRGTPMMVQAMVIYYGLAGLGLQVPTLPAALVIVSINTGAYMAEIIRGGIISVDKGQKEGAHAIGMSHWQCMVHVVLPQAVRNVMPSIGNEFVVNIKDSSVLNVISVSELFFISKSAAGTYLRYFEVFFITAIIYLFLTFTITRLLRILERKMDGKANYTICGSQSDSQSTITVKKEDIPDD